MMCKELLTDGGLFEHKRLILILAMIPGLQKFFVLLLFALSMSSHSVGLLFSPSLLLALLLDNGGNVGVSCSLQPSCVTMR